MEQFQESQNAQQAPWRILAIDDDPGVLETYHSILDCNSESQFEDVLAELLTQKEPAERGPDEINCVLDETLSGEEGYQLVKEATAQGQPYAVILLDMRMPSGWDGVRTAEKIREVDSDVRIILITAYMDYQLTQIRQRIGVDFEFLSKPMDHDELHQLVKLHARQWSQRQEFKRYHDKLEGLVAQRAQELKQANRQVAQSMEALAREKGEIELILESMREGVVAVDRLGNIKHVNRSLERLTGKEEAQLAGRPVQMLFAEAEVNRGLATEALAVVSKRLQQMVGDSHNEVDGWIRSSLLPAMLVDPQGTILSCNSAMEGVTGHRSDALLGKTVDLLLPEEIRATHAQYVEAFFREVSPRKMGGDRLLTLQQENGDIIQIEIGLLPLRVNGESRVLALIHDPQESQQWDLFQITPFGKLFAGEEQSQSDWHLKHRDGSTIPTYVTGAPLYADEKGKYQFNGAVLVLHDMREILNAEKERQENRAKDEFLASTSHELRTPLTTIIGNSEMLSDSQLNDEQQQMLRSVDVAGRGLLALINDILDLSKIEAGKFQIDDGDYDLHLLVHEIEHIFSSRIADAGLCFDINYPAHLTHQLIGDNRRIGQIMINLLGNAIKFTKRGMITLSIGIDEEKREVYFSVEDTGIGMAPEVLDRLFQPYEQADSSISRRYGGTGLGLHISWILAELMGGSIEVESELDKGSCFHLRLPLMISELPAVAIDEGGVTAPPRWYHGMVLVAEDVPELQLLERKMLQSMGLDVTVAKNGKEALERALEQPFDLILMDMQMPEMDGIEATQLLRQVGCETPVVPLTANVMQKHRDLFAEVGCNDFLSKPIDRIALQDVLGRYLQERSEEDSASLQVMATSGQDVVVDEEMMQLFVDRSKQKKQELVTAMSQQNWEEVRNIAHMIKGTGTSFGHPEMTQLGKEICDLIDEQEVKAVTPLVEQLAKEMMRVVCKRKS